MPWNEIPMFDNAWNSIYKKDEGNVNKIGENKEVDPLEADDNIEAAKLWALSEKRSGH